MSRGARWAVVPVKELTRAKRRLADALDPAGRRALSLAMLGDVLDALAATAALDGVALVSRDAAALGLAERRGLRVIEETGEGLNAAVAQAARVLSDAACATMLVVPADVPLASPDEVGTLLGAHPPGPALSLVPDRGGTGTNAFACSPPEAVPPRFGRDSLARHRRAAGRRGLACQVLELPGLGLDLDTAEDLDALLRRPGSTRAQAVLRQALERASQRPGRAAERAAAGGRT